VRHLTACFPDIFKEERTGEGANQLPPYPLKAISNQSTSERTVSLPRPQDLSSTSE
jgi:hypothetical protein